jgi:hypothetical protein
MGITKHHKYFCRWTYINRVDITFVERVHVTIWK